MSRSSAKNASWPPDANLCQVWPCCLQLERLVAISHWIHLSLRVCSAFLVLFSSWQAVLYVDVSLKGFGSVFLL